MVSRGGVPLQCVRYRGIALNVACSSHALQA